MLPVIHLELPHTLHLLTAKASVIRQLVAVGLSGGRREVAASLSLSFSSDLFFVYGSSKHFALPPYALMKKFPLLPLLLRLDTPPTPLRWGLAGAVIYLQHRKSNRTNH